MRGFPGGAVVKSPPVNAGGSRDMGLILRTGTSPEVGNGNLLQYFCLENSLDRGIWWATIHGGFKEWELTELLSTAQQDTERLSNLLQTHSQ